MKENIRHISFVLFFCTALRFVCTAQDVRVSSSLDSNSILIGEQVKLHLLATYKGAKGSIKIQWPQIADSLAPKVSVIGKTKVDSVKGDSLHPFLRELKQDLLITGFDSGYYAIPPFKFIINGDTAHPEETEPLMLYVRTVAVDTTKAFRDIKGPVTAPFSILEVLPWIGLGVLGFLVLTLIIALIVIATENKKPLQKVVREIPIEPHIKALNALEALIAQKLWQEGKIKEYHSGLTDILRTYLDDRFGINAQEMITDEIVYAMRKIDIEQELKSKLKQVLVLADLVKFAKEQPLPKEHEDSFNTLVEFINRTAKQKEAEVVNQPPAQAQPTPDIQQP